MEEIQNCSKMLRVTTKNSSQFYNQIADYIDTLEDTITLLKAQLLKYEKLEGTSDDK